ncbi:MAG TPA: PH domain-containing protein [Kofleriaceae bacterium]|nr:PH domain-containing protein [Kofleriaceae bacterium]
MAGAGEVTWFRSKIDWWLGALLLILPVAVTVGAVAAIATGNGGIAAVIGWGVIAAVYGGLIFPLRYGVGGGELVIRHGLVRQRCKLSDIIEVEPTRSPLSSPALSLDRLVVRKGDGFFDSIMISPDDKQGFLALLAEQSGLERSGDTLRRPER